MRHRVKTKKLDRKKASREMMLRNLAASVLIYEKVKTTKAKANVVRSLVEKIITIAKKDNLEARRRIIKKLPQKMAVKKTMEVLGKCYQDRNGGYTRIVKLDNRTGDGAEMAIIELIK
ncbi:MAG: 50S ribosomal protein L17 [Patescibacteria group bacterium]|nr:50S ribosomal protein L17 [Patescibacteria group bacterium]